MKFEYKVYSATTKPNDVEDMSIAGAVRAWRGGDRRRAMEIARQLSSRSDAVPEAFNNLGFMLMHEGSLGEAVSWFQKAVDGSPAYWEAWVNMGLALRQLGKALEADEAFLKAQESAPEQRLVWLEPANCWARQGNGEAAAAVLKRGIHAQSPGLDLLPFLLDLHRRHGEWGRVSEELKAYRDLLSRQPQVLHGLLNGFQPAVEALPASTETCLILAGLESDLGAWDFAEHKLERIIEADGKDVRPWRLLASVRVRRGNLPGALLAHEAVLRLCPGDWEAWNDGGCTLRAMGRIDEALRWMLRGTESNSGVVTLWANAALLSYEKHDYEQAQSFLDRAFALDPDHPESMHTQAMLWAGLGLHSQAEEMERKVLQLKPDYPQARLSLALFELTLGKWESGFQGYELRWVGSDKAETQALPTVRRPQWKGGRVYPGSCIAVLPEQGFGDQLHFARFIPQLLEHFHRVEWVVPPELVVLMQQSFIDYPNIRITADPSALLLHLVDYEIPLMSLPLALGVTLENLRPAGAYLKADETLRAQWQARLRYLPGIKVGLAWAGRPTLSKHELRMVAPSALEALERPDFTFVSLHKRVSASEQLPRLSSLVDWMEDCRTFADTAALVASLDVVVATDTAVAHLAGALGKPVMLMNRLGGEWRWLDKRRDTPWYPSMRIFNQQTLKDWSGVISEVREELEKFAAGDASR